MLVNIPLITDIFIPNSSFVQGCEFHAKILCKIWLIPTDVKHKYNKETEVPPF